MSPVKPINHIYLRPTAPSSPCSLDKNAVTEKVSPKITIKTKLIPRKFTEDIKKEEKGSVENRAASIGCKIDKIKCSLRCERKMMSAEDEVVECPSPCKVYSPLLYKNRLKISLTDFEDQYFH